MVVIDVSKVWPPTFRLTRSPIVLIWPAATVVRAEAQDSQLTFGICAPAVSVKAYKEIDQSKRQVVPALTH